MSSYSSSLMGSSSGPSSPAGPVDTTAQMNTYRSYVTILADPAHKEENKLKAAQALSEELESIIAFPQYPAFLEHAMKIFLKILNDGQPLFLGDQNMQMLRKCILDIIQRLPTNDHLKVFVRPILVVCFKLLEIDNEENVMGALHIVTEMHKTFRPQFSPEIQRFLSFVKNMYRNLPKHMACIFEPRAIIKVRDIADLNIEALLEETFTVTIIHTEKKMPDGSPVMHNLIPRATKSLKVLTELPIIFVLMLQLYKDQVFQDVIEFIPLIMDTIVLEPPAHLREQDSFNKELFVDLIGAQIKILSFLAYIVKSFQEKVSCHSNKLVSGMLNLLKLCPNEVASLRRELLIATKHILALELRKKFVPHIHLLFDEDLLFGKGWTAQETLRPLAYSTLADLVHHVRAELDMTALSKAVHLFSKNIHDDTLPPSIQTMSCKLLLNLVDCLKDKSDDQKHPVLFRMLQIFVQKIKALSQVFVPMLKARHQCANSLDVDAKTEDKTSPNVKEEKVSDDVPKTMLCLTTPPTFTVNDGRALAKTLISGVKTVTWGYSPHSLNQDQVVNTTPLNCRDIQMYLRFIKWGLQAVDIFSINPTTPGHPAKNQLAQSIRAKEEREVLEHFAGVFIIMHPTTFKEIFNTCIDEVIERAHNNSALQIVLNSLLARPESSPLFATILVEYLLKHMDELGTQSDRASLNLKLFKLVFGSVSILAADNELMLKPYLHQIVNKSMELAMTARDPYNYFLLLRALFRSIGGGNHDILYQEFLPLLPTLLQGLNSLQSGLHKQHMKDLFVELCLTVPVRLSSLLPYLPMLMDPLVSALNGSQTLISQGLRTLELCVDNLQPDFLYEHIQPVRAELMQALWKTMRNPNDHIAQVTFRVLGKFGGGNRKMMTEPQTLEYRHQQSYTSFMVVRLNEQKQPVRLPVERIIESAFTALKISTTETWYRQQSWEVIRCFLVGSMQVDEDRMLICRLFTDPSFKEGDIPSLQGQYYKCPDEQARHTHLTAVTALFVAAAIKELRNDVLHTMIAIVRHYTMIAIAQQAGPFRMTGKWHKVTGMDPLVLIDALVFIMGHEEKELCKPGHLALVLIMTTAIDILGSKERACKLPLMEYLAEKMSGLCYERAWYAKLGGCIAIKLLFEIMSLHWVLQHQFMFLRALIYVIMDLTDEVSTGAVEKSVGHLEKMLHVCASPLEGVNDTPEMRAVQSKSLFEVTNELVRQVTSPNNTVRLQSMKSLQLLATLTGKGVTEVMKPHKDVLVDMIPPKKHFILRHQPANIQIGLMEGNTFCTTLKPRLFTLDLDIAEHKNFFGDLHQLVEKDDASLVKFSCYKNVTNLVPLRKAALKALTACHYIVKDSEKLFCSLCKVLNTNTNTELQETAFECLQNFLRECNLSRESIHGTVRPLLSNFYNVRCLTIPILQRLSYWIRLFPSTFHEKLCEQLVNNVKQLTEPTSMMLRANSSPDKHQHELKLFSLILTILQQMQQTSPCHIEPLCSRVFCTEQALMHESASALRPPLMKLCLRYPKETCQLFLSDKYVGNELWGRLLYFWIRHIDGGPFLDQIGKMSERLLTVLVTYSTPVHQSITAAIVNRDRDQGLFLVVRLLSILSKRHPNFLASNPQVVNALKNLWNSDHLHQKYLDGNNFDVCHWAQPRMIVQILLTYFKEHTNEIKLLFSLLRCFIGRFILEFQFVKEFFEEIVAKTYPVEWKRKAFFQFAEVFQDANVSQELKARILQYCIIPSFSHCLYEGEGDALIGYPPNPDHDTDDNVITVFIYKIIDPDEPSRCLDVVRILLLQLSCLLVDKAADHIHDAANKRQGVKLRRLMTFAWPCLLLKNCVDPATKYHGHLLLSHIIAKFAIHKRIVLQVFHSLLKAYALEARAVVKQALEILTPAMPIRMEDGNTMLIHWTRKILVEEGHTAGQLVHILQLIVRHSQVYYPVRGHLIQHITPAMHRLGFTASVNSDQRKLAVELAEMCIRWEEQKIAEDNSCTKSAVYLASKRSSSTETGLSDSKRQKVSASVSRTSVEPSRLMEKQHVDAIVYFLLRLACQINESAPVPGTTPPGEAISKRCVALLKKTFHASLWPNADPKLMWMDKFFQTLDTPQVNLTNVSVGIELFTFLITAMRKDLILTAIKALTKGLLCCITYQNPKIVKLSHNMVFKLMTTFPSDPSNPAMSSKHQELEDLYSKIAKSIFEGLSNYEKNETVFSSSIYGTIMMLKAACLSNPCYIDRLITVVMKVVQRMTRDHFNPHKTDNTGVLNELLTTTLDIVKTRIGVMGGELKKVFIGQILVVLIEKTPDVRVMKTVTKIVDEWVRDKSAVAGNQGPVLREKSILLVRLMQCVEKRFSDEAELLAMYLELVLFVFTDDVLKHTELTSKLEPAFLAGLRSNQPHIRNKFFQVFNESISSNILQRLLYITCSQNWENMGSHFWIKQCIEMILITGTADRCIEENELKILLPKISFVTDLAEPKDKAKFTAMSNSREDVDEFLFESLVVKEDEIDMDAAAVGHTLASSSAENPLAKLKTLLSSQNAFFKNIGNLNMLSAVSQLCHMDTSLAEWMWLQLYPNVWSSLNESQQQRLNGEIVPFICSGSHIVQRDCHPSALNTFVEALTHCQPPVVIRPCVMKYLGQSHNLWHRMTLLLEQNAYEMDAINPPPRGPRREVLDAYDNDVINPPQQEVVDALAEMYSMLGEEDLWAGLWQNTAHYPETKMAVTYQQHGFLDQAQATYELAMSKARNDMACKPSPVRLNSELKLWETQWLKCAKELNQWEAVLEYGKNENNPNPLLVLESSWHVDDWSTMKEALAQIELSYPREIAWKINLFKGYVAICLPEPQFVAQVEKNVENCTNMCIKEWKRLPHVVSHIHLTYLQAAQQVMELQEASQIHQGLIQNRGNALHDMKAIIKTWRNRLPVLSDSLRHWSDIFTWRQHHYQFVVAHYADIVPESNGQSMLGVHASAQAIIHFGKIARKHNLSSVCLDSLSRIHQIQSVPIVDCFQKIRQQVKCYYQMAIANNMAKNELQEGLEVIESTNLKFFTKEMIAEFFALKGMFFSQLSRTDDANRAFSAAVQMYDTLVKGWALWGDYMEGLFTRDPAQKDLGAAAITCYLHASRHQNESKSRKYIAKVFFLLSYDDEGASLSDAVEKYSVGVPAIQWLLWIPQLLTCLVRPEGKVILSLLNQVGKIYPQAVYLPIRSLYLTLRIEQRGRYRRDSTTPASQQQQPAQPAGEQGPIRATEAMRRCSRILQIQRDYHPTILVSLEGFAEQMLWFRESWYEEVLRQLRQALAKCYAVAFENSACVAEAQVTPHTQSFVRKLVATFGIGFENVSSSVNSGSQESLAKRAQATVQDPVFHKLKTQITSDLDFAQPGAMKLHNVILKLKQWVKVLEVKVKALPKTNLMEEKCRFLSNFCLQTAEVELPGEFLLPKQSNYYIRISRFLPKVDVVQKHGSAPRRLHIRGHNGRIYPYLIVSDSSLSDGCREERVLQLLRMLNHFFSKQKETSKRLVNMSVMKVVAVSPQMRLVEDNVSSLSLLDIYKQQCHNNKIQPDAPINKYYEKLAAIQARGAQASHQVLREVLKEVQNTMVPPTMLKEWALRIFPNPTNYWTFRKMMILQISVISLMEYALHLTRLYPDMMYIHQDSGLINVAYFKFNIDDTKGELDGNWPVPFRITPNLCEVATSLGVSGPLTATMVASARCLATPSLKVSALLRAIIRDEVIAWHKRREGTIVDPNLQGINRIEGDALVTRVNKAVSTIMARIHTLGTLDGADNKVIQMVRAVNCLDNLCRMDPAWHPWL